MVDHVTDSWTDLDNVTDSWTDLDNVADSWTDMDSHNSTSIQCRIQNTFYGGLCPSGPQRRPADDLTCEIHNELMLIPSLRMTTRTVFIFGNLASRSERKL